MNTTLQELTEKIYAEGVEKGNQEAAKIVAEAQAKAGELVNNAQKEAEQIVANARKLSEEISLNTKSELGLFARQSVNALKTEVANMICNKVVEEAVKQATKEPDFLKGVILEVAKQWAQTGVVEIQTKNAEALTAYFAANAKALLDKGVKITEVKKLATEFALLPEDGSYKVTFGEAEFEAYFKAFLRPKLVEMLFGDNK